MGQYLSLGLVTKMSVSRKKLEKENISKEELKNKIEKSLLFDMNLYDESEENDSIVFYLQDKVIERGLFSLLEELYPLIYKGDEHSDYPSLLDTLLETPCTEWLDLAHDSEYYCYRIDKYGESEYLSFEDKPFRPSINLNCDSISLYMSHGKISTEGVGNFFEFFKHCMIETFKGHPIAKSLRIYITG